MKQICWILFIFVCIQFHLLSPVLCQNVRTESDEYLVKTVPLFQYKELTIFESILKLCKEQNIRISVEDIQPPKDKQNTKFEYKKINGIHKNKSVMEILNEICKEDPDYIWEYSRNGLLNVIPRSTTLGTYDNSTLSWGMNGFKIQTASFQFMLSDKFPFGMWLKQYGIQIDWTKSTSLSDIHTRVFTINLPTCTGRDGFNSMVKSAGRNYLWHLYWRKNQPIVEFVEAFKMKTD